MWETVCSVSCLVEWLDKWHVQRRDLVTDTEVHICLCPWVGYLHDDGATVEGPEGTVAGGGGLIDTTAGVGPIFSILVMIFLMRGGGGVG